MRVPRSGDPSTVHPIGTVREHCCKGSAKTTVCWVKQVCCREVKRVCWEAQLSSILFTFCQRGVHPSEFLHKIIILHKILSTTSLPDPNGDFPQRVGSTRPGGVPGIHQNPCFACYSVRVGEGGGLRVFHVTWICFELPSTWSRSSNLVKMSSLRDGLPKQFCPK